MWRERKKACFLCYDCDKLRPVGKPRGGQGREGRVK